MPMFHAAVFNLRGDRFATYSQDGEIQVWDTQSARPVIGVMHHSTIIQAITFSDDGRRLLTGPRPACRTRAVVFVAVKRYLPALFTLSSLSSSLAARSNWGSRPAR